MAIIKAKKAVNSVAQAIEKSANAINVLTSTIEQLKEANEELTQLREKDLERVAVIERNINDSKAQEMSNKNIIERLNAIIGG